MRSRRLVLAARVAVTTALLAVLLPRIHLGRIHWGAAAAAWLAAGLVASLAGIVVASVRWQRVIEALGMKVRLPALVSYYLAGEFVGKFLPSTVGGDVLRVSRLAVDTRDRPSSFASVVIERLTGWLVLPVITFFGFLINPGLRHVDGPAVHVAVLLAVGSLAGLSAVLFLAAHPRLGGRLAQGEGWVRFIGAVHLGIERLRRQPAAAAAVILVGFAYQLTVVLSAFLAAKALGVHVSFTVFLTFFPMVAIAQVLPISIGGIGLREGALVIFLVESGLGASNTQAVTLGLVFYAMNLVVSLLGAPAFAFGPRPPATRLEAA
jgi:glycosyltransferase 2 family protein